MGEKSKTNNKKPYTGKISTLTLKIPLEWDQYLESLTNNKQELIKFLIGDKLYKTGMINIQPEFNDYKSELFKD